MAIDHNHHHSFIRPLSHQSTVTVTTITLLDIINLVGLFALFTLLARLDLALSLSLLTLRLSVLQILALAFGWFANAYQASKAAETSEGTSETS